ncbi:hypothetical protein [Acetivibrio clariflavus]|uniref:hypothetical protein n=1 Tax=Acetivibrio clariflavus TaxID=288965 RepID=UPI000484BE68|nr:hypothetical protein [Acetivibrio clariflavus]
MAMTPLEMLEFYETGYKGSQNGIVIGKQKHDLYLVAQNYHQSFKCKLMQGLISWRTGIDIPTKYLCDAVDVANVAVDDLKSLGSKNIAEDFFIEIAAIIAFIVNKPFEIHEFSKEGIVFDRLLSFELAQSLNGKSNELEWIEIINKQKKSRRTELCLLTYNNYRELMFNNDPNKIDELVKKGEELFKKRKTDSFYSGGEAIEGGGPDNDFTIDYELAAILKKIDYQGTSIHKYIWS